jgi:hypothetical protein
MTTAASAAIAGCEPEVVRINPPRVAGALPITPPCLMFAATVGGDERTDTGKWIPPQVSPHWLQWQVPGLLEVGAEGRDADDRTWQVRTYDVWREWGRRPNGDVPKHDRLAARSQSSCLRVIGVS